MVMHPAGQGVLEYPLGGRKDSDNAGDYEVAY